MKSLFFRAVNAAMIAAIVGTTALFVPNALVLIAIPAVIALLEYRLTVSRNLQEYIPGFLQRFIWMGGFPIVWTAIIMEFSPAQGEDTLGWVYLISIFAAGMFLQPMKKN